MKQKLNIFFSLLCLLATSVVTIATSKNSDTQQQPVNYYTAETLNRKNYYVASNCPQSVPQERITVTNDFIEYPPQLNFSHFGLPTERLNLLATPQISNAVQGHQRNCVRSDVADRGVLLTVYTCYESGAYLCQVSFEPAQ